jgi:SAM-dependent methyltransferase
MSLRASYSRIAAIVLPIAIVAVAWFAYADVSRRRAAADDRDDDAPHASHPRPTKEAFSRIYEKAKWGKNAEGKGNSGAGSTLDNTLIYRVYLQQFLADHHIASVVDAGCGDWEFSRVIDWSGIDYKGYDIVDAVIAADQQQYTAPNVHFFTANIVDDPLPKADLLIVKHVLQHLSNADVAKFFTKLANYKYVLLTDGVNKLTLSGDNADINAGQYRDLDPTKPPFGLAGSKVLTYADPYGLHQVVLVTPGQ